MAKHNLLKYTKPFFVAVEQLIIKKCNCTTIGNGTIRDRYTRWEYSKIHINNNNNNIHINNDNNINIY